jgi:cation diffusion facilitator family transporter
VKILEGLNYSAKLTKKGIKTTLIGIISSFFLAIIKIVSGVLGNSYALVADGIESLSDIFTSTIVLFGLRVASKPPDENHPYGHGKAEPLAGVVVALALLAAAVIIIIQSIHEIITPHHAPAPFTLIVLVLVIIIKESLFKYTDKIGARIESIAVKNDAWHHRSDAITSGAAFIGISIALIGGRGYEEADDYAALFASLIIIFNAYILIKPSIYELMDTSPSAEVIENVKAETMKVEGVIIIDKCYVRKMGLDYVVDIQILVDGKIPVYEGNEIAHKVKDKLRKKFPKIIDVSVHVEPNALPLKNLLLKKRLSK